MERWGNYTRNSSVFAHKSISKKIKTKQNKTTIKHRVGLHRLEKLIYNLAVILIVTYLLYVMLEQNNL